MSYEPTNWKTGDVVTSTKLNKLEQGVSDAGGIVAVSRTISMTEGGAIATLDISYDGIVAAMSAGKVPMLIYEEEGTTYYAALAATHANEGTYYNATFGELGTTQYEAETSDAYLSASLA